MQTSVSRGQARTAPVARRRKRFSVGRLISYIVVIAVAIVMMVPFIWAFSSALKTNNDIFSYPPQFFPTAPHWEHFAQGWCSAIGGNTSDNCFTIFFPDAPTFTNFTINTLVIATLIVVGTVLSCVVVAYGFARFRFPGRNVLFLIMLSTMMIPYAVTLIPQYIFFSRIGWVNTILPLVVPAFFASPYFVFLLRQFFMSIPYDLDEAARIDGAGSLRILMQVLLPEVRPAVIAMSVLTFIGAWKDFLAPVVYLQDAAKYTIEVGLAQFHNAVAGQPRWDLLTAVSLVTMIPMIIIFFFSSRYIVEGVTLSGMGGN